MNPEADVERAKLLAEYSEIRKRAQSGDAEDKLDAFLLIYKNMGRLQGELPEAMGRLYLGRDCKRKSGVKLLQELASHGYEPAKETRSAFSEVIESDSASPECLTIRK